MNKIKRLISQALFWFLVWFILWLNDQSNDRFVETNSFVFVLQVLLIFGLIYFAAPKLLFKKKQFYFVIFSVALVSISAYFSSDLFLRPPNEHFPIGPPDVPPPHLEQIYPPEGIDGMRQGKGPNPIPQFVINLLMLSMAYILAILVEAYLFVKKTEEEVILTKNEKLQNELKLLKSQINPHFLFNSLNNIYTLAGIDSNRTQKSIINLSDMLRYVLYECDQETVPLKKEVEYIENYLKLFALKSSKNYPISTKLNIENNSIPVAPMLFIPFVENAIKHSNIDDRENSFINIKINADADTINFEIENSKPQKVIIKDAVGGIGLENVKKRLAILYPEKHDLEISETDTNFRVNLHLNLA